VKKGVIFVTDDEFDAAIQKGVVLVDFTASWCGPCRMLSPVLDQVAEELGDRVKIVKVDIESSQRTTAHFQITSVPTMILFRNGQEVSRLMGHSSAENIKRFISS
jgi:thioredoxin 1